MTAGSIAYLLNQYPMPSQTFIRREIRALEAMGHEVDRFSIRASDGDLVDPDDRDEAALTRVVLSGNAPLRLVRGLFGESVRNPGAVVRGLRMAWTLGRRSDKGLLTSFVYLAEACVLLGWLRESGSTHVHAHFGTNAPAVATLIRSLGGPPFSFTIHGPEEFDRPEALHLREKVRSAAFVVVISSFGRSQLYRWCDAADRSKIHIVHCGLDADFLDQEIVPVPAVPRLVCIGRLAEQKGQFILVDATLRLLDEGVELELVLGGDGPLRDELTRKISAAGASDQITITGWIDNATVRAELLGSRALVLPSFAEGLPVAIMEALALGRPVVTTTVAGIPELVDEECGRVVPPGSVDDLATAMRDILDASPASLDAMGRVGRERVRARHDAAIEAGRLAGLITDAQRDTPH